MQALKSGLFLGPRTLASRCGCSRLHLKSGGTLHRKTGQKITRRLGMVNPLATRHSYDAERTEEMEIL
jgi:hypothetical protein